MSRPINDDIPSGSALCLLRSSPRPGHAASGSVVGATVVGKVALGALVVGGVVLAGGVVVVVVRGVAVVGVGLVVVLLGNVLPATSRSEERPHATTNSNTMALTETNLCRIRYR
jgi:hypothetical protein